MTTKSVKLLNLYASPRGTFPAQSVVDLPDKEADQLVKEGYAVHVSRQANASVAKKSGAGKEKGPATETATAEHDKETATAKKHEDKKAE